MLYNECNGRVSIEGGLIWRMAKSKDFKKPVNSQETIISEDEEKNKKLIIFVCLLIVVVLSLIIGSISYFNSKGTTESKKNTKDNNNKPTEIITKDPVENEIPEEEEKPIVTYPVNKKDNDNVVAVTPEDPKEETSVVTSVNENDYSVVINGNTAYVSGVSRYVAIGTNTYENVVQLRFLLDKNYKDGDNIIVSTTSNGITDNSFTYDINPDENGNYYLDWIHPVGNGNYRPTTVTIRYENGSELTYNIDLSELRAERQVTDNEESELFVVPTDVTGTTAIYTFPYTVEIFRQLTAEEIDWLENQDTNIISDSNLLTDEDSTYVDTNVDDDSKDDTSDDVNETPEADYSKDLWYTVKFEKNENSNTNGSINSNLPQDDSLRLIKVYAPIVRDSDGNIIAIDPDKVIITGVTDKESDGHQLLGVVYSDGEAYDENGQAYTKYYTYLGLSETEDEEEKDNPIFTIDWDGEDGTDYGKYTYEFDLSGLHKEDTNEDVLLLDQEDDMDDDNEINDDTEQPNEVNETDTPVEPDISSQNDTDNNMNDNADTISDGALI